MESRGFSFDEPKRAGRGWGYLAIAATVVVLGVFFWLAGRQGAALHDENAAPRPVTPRGELGADERATIDVYKQASPSVVFIATSTQQRLNLNLLDIRQGSGSGFIWDEQGNIVTNYHVVEGAERFQVTLANRSQWEAELVGVAPDKDLAVLRIKTDNGALPPLKVGASQDLEVGQTVLAIGNPFGLDQTLTKGVISGLGREIRSLSDRPIRDVIQTDAAINPGNSGGPLLDSEGRLIGVNTTIASPTGAYAGVGFAVPVDEVNRIVPQLIRDGKVTRPGLGVVFFSDADTRSAGLQGGLIQSMLPDSAAARAGLLDTRYDERGRLVLGDLIVAIDGAPVAERDEILKILDRHAVGDVLKLTVLRGESQLEVAVTLQELPVFENPSRSGR